MAAAVIDANVLVALLDNQDKWHDVAIALRDELNKAEAELVYFDCVINETISVLARRTCEQKRPEQLYALLDQLERLIPISNITWASRPCPAPRSTTRPPRKRRRTRLAISQASYSSFRGRHSAWHTARATA